METRRGPNEPLGKGNDLILVYDEYRFVSGTAKNEDLRNLVRQFGKLSGEQIYNKQLYLKVKLKGKNKNNLEVRTAEIFHNQGW